MYIIDSVLQIFHDLDTIAKILLLYSTTLIIFIKKLPKS